MTGGEGPVLLTSACAMGRLAVALVLLGCASVPGAPLRRNPRRPPVESRQIFGRVIAEHGSPVAGAAVQYFDGVTQLQTFSDAGGRFSMRVPVPGEGTLLAAHPELGWASYELHPFRDGRRSEPPYPMRLDRGLALSGRLVDERGRPVSGLRLVLTVRVGISSYYDHHHALTGSDGSFSFLPVHPGLGWFVHGLEDGWSCEGRWLRVTQPRSHSSRDPGAASQPIELRAERTECGIPDWLRAR